MINIIKQNVKMLLAIVFFLVGIGLTIMCICFILQQKRNDLNPIWFILAAFSFFSSIIYLLYCLSNWSIVEDNVVICSSRFKKYKYEIAKIKVMALVFKKKELWSSESRYIICSMIDDSRIGYT